jgi:hypothetical protein
MLFHGSNRSDLEEAREVLFFRPPRALLKLQLLVYEARAPPPNLCDATRKFKCARSD